MSISFERLARRSNPDESVGNPVVTIHECDSDDEPVIYRDDSDESKVYDVRC
jgi:hypothetical protein